MPRMTEAQKKLPVRSEHEEQKAVIAWAKVMESQFPKLRLLYAVPNAGKRTFAMAAFLQAEGMKPGVPDLVLPVARCGFHGLYVEMKRRNAVPSDVSTAQREWIRMLIEEEYAVAVAKGADMAREIIASYMAGNFVAGDFSGVDS
jgi:hypothetical protein